MKFEIKERFSSSRILCFRLFHLLISTAIFMPQIMAQNANAQLIVAHRGASHDAPENTLAAFNMAFEQKSDGVEGDFYLSSDGHIVCIHDKTTKRTAGKDLNVSKSTLAELKKLDVGKWKDKRFTEERIPTLEEVIAIVPNGKRLIIELKVGPEIVAPMKTVLKKSKLKPEQVLVISFNDKTIAESKRLLPKIKAHWLTGYRPKKDNPPYTPTAKSIADTIRKCKADGLGSHGRRSVFDKQFINSLGENGVKEFHVWTIDDPDDARYYKSLGAYGITTNRPALIRSELDRDAQ